MSTEAIRRIFGGRKDVAVGMAFAVILALFWPTLRSFPGVWVQYGRGHGWLIAALVGWLIWRHRREILKGSRGDGLLLLPLGALSLAWFVATVVHVQVGHQLAFVAVLVLWGLAVFGRPAGKPILVAGATFLIALPIWGVFTPPLRRMTTLASGGLVSLTGIDNEIRGDVIHIAAGSFLVEDGCAGLAYFVSALAVGALYAHLFVRSLPRQFAIVGLAAIIAIVGNWFRVGSLIVIGHMTEMQSGLIDHHGDYGWGIFAVSLVPFLLLARKIEKGEGKLGSQEAGPGQLVSTGSAETGEPEGGELHRAGRLRWTIQSTAVAVAGPAIFLLLSSLPVADSRGVELIDLGHSAGWQAASPTEPSPLNWQPAYQGADVHETVVFTDANSHIRGDRFLYREQTQGAKLIGYPNQIAPGSDILDNRVIGPVDAGGRRWVRQAIVRHENRTVLVWYWYRVGGKETFSPLQAKLLELPAFLARRPSAELVAYSTECRRESCAEAFEALASFMGTRVRSEAATPRSSS